MATASALDSLHVEHQLRSAHRCSCGWEGDSATTHIIDAIGAAGIRFLLPMCGADTGEDDQFVMSCLLAPGHAGDHDSRGR